MLACRIKSKDDFRVVFGDEVIGGYCPAETGELWLGGKAATIREIPVSNRHAGEHEYSDNQGRFFFMTIINKY
jgi:hypothetical protein